MYLDKRKRTRKNLILLKNVAYRNMCNGVHITSYKQLHPVVCVAHLFHCQLTVAHDRLSPHRMEMIIAEVTEFVTYLHFSER